MFLVFSDRNMKKTCQAVVIVKLTKVHWAAFKSSSCKFVITFKWPGSVTKHLCYRRYRKIFFLYTQFDCVSISNAFNHFYYYLLVMAKLALSIIRLFWNYTCWWILEMISECWNNIIIIFLKSRPITRLQFPLHILKMVRWLAWFIKKERKKWRWQILT